MKDLPEDFDKNFDKIKLEDIQVGDFIIYKAKERSFKGKDYPERWCQGYVSMRQNEVGKETFDTDGGEVVGFKNRGILWTVNSKNVLEWHKSKKTKEIREKATKRKKDTEPAREKKRQEKRKAEAEVLENDKEVAKDIEKNPDVIQTIRKEIEKELEEKKQPEEPAEKPAKKPRSARQPRKSTTKPATK